ncbi:MAG: hypothetical protein LW629_08395 [Burkholderiales bacterium]|jgi:hypothetical protein|nr:hypothetical protein [Burkholderiales bacterium]
MKENNKLRIVPQVLSGFFLVWTLCVRSVFALEAPVVPSNLAEAEAFTQMKSMLESQAEEKLQAKETQCYQKTLISNCLRAVEKERSQFKRDMKIADNAASELFRVERVRQKEERKRERDALEEEKASRADTKAYQPKPERSPDAAPPPPKGKPLREAPADTPAISADQQAENKRIFEEKQKESVRMRAENAKRIAEQEERRQRYKADQEANRPK